MRARVRTALVVAALGLGLLAPVALAGPTTAPLADPVPVIGETDEAKRCDVIDPAHCLLPFPNDHFTVPDAASPTGRRVALSALSTPRNIAGKPIETAEWNRNDGFSPGQGLVTVVPGLDLRRTGATSVTDLRGAARRDNPVVVLDARTLRPHPVFAELDATDDTRQTLLVRPTRNYAEATRYVVALRRMRTASGALIPSSPAFAALRDRTASSDAAVEARRPRMEELFATLARAGIARRDLYLAWEFTTASAQNLAGRMLHIRDDAFAALGAAAPQFQLTGIHDYPPTEKRTARRITGRLLVPSYLNLPGGPPGSRLNYAPGAELPSRLPGNVQPASVICDVPRSVVHDLRDPGAVVRPGNASIYGHGLLGSNEEVGAGNVRDMGFEHRFVFCAVDWQGMAFEDIPNVGAILHDVSLFPGLADRVQQGMLNQLFLARWMKHPQGLAGLPQMQVAGKPVVRTGTVYYDGNSQGGIIGGALMAVATDITRGVLGVPGMNYSVLLDRSVDFDTYSSFMYRAYPDGLDQQLIFQLMQMLWDRAEANGYAHHMTDRPYPGTPKHQVLMHAAFADHQVATLTAETEARTIGARIHQPALGRGRHYDRVPFVGLTPLPDGPFRGSAIVLWDSGTPTPPAANIPPRAGEDPHEHPRRQRSARLQKAIFLTRGVVVDVCGNRVCRAA